MGWKPETSARRSQERAEEGRAEGPTEQVALDLQARGVSAASAELLAPYVVGQLAGQEADAYGPTLDGVALTCRAQRVVSDDLAQSARDLQEVERLMSSFAGELSKLDETLEVLAAYLRRMRTTAPPSIPDQLLH